MRSNGRTGITKLTVAFQNFSNAPNSEGYKPNETVAWLRTFDFATWFGSQNTNLLLRL